MGGMRPCNIGWCTYFTIMKKSIKIPGILKIKSVKGFKISCIFNNGETRVIDYEALFQKWKITENDPEYLLLKESEF